MRVIERSFKLLIFLLIFAFSFNYISCVLINKCVDGFTPEQHEMIPDFYRERPGSLDAVWIGASSVYNFYQAPIGWGQSGIAIYPYSSGSQPFAALQFLIEEVRKTQPQALIIADLNRVDGRGVSSAVVHYFADWMPFSKTKLDMIDYLYNNGEGAESGSSLEYFFPIIRYHTRWDQLMWQDLHYTETGGMKGAKKFDQFLKQTADVSKNDKAVTSPAELTEYEFKILKDVLDYCDQNNVHILFVIVPQYVNEYRDAKFLWAQKYVIDRGYPVLNLKEFVGGGYTT